MLIYVAHAYKEMGQFQLARNQLEAVHGLLHLPSDMALTSADDETRRGLLICLELEDARIVAGEEKIQEAIDQIDVLLAKYRSDLLSSNLAEIYQVIQRDRAFLLSHLRRFDEALQLLEELYPTDPHDRRVLFYLGYSYLCTANYAKAHLRLTAAIQSGLPSDYEGRARCFLGSTLYELKDFAEAKVAMEKGVKTAPPRFIKEGKTWARLRDICISLGLRTEAEHYASLDKGASKPC